MSADKFFAYARERYSIFLRRGPLWAQTEGPWTGDPVLRTHRFCNIFREDDRVTRWMRERLTRPIGPDPERQVRAATVFRWFNKIETGEVLRPLLLGDWDVEEARRVLQERVDGGNTILGAGYMIKSPTGMNKVDGLLWCISQINFHDLADRMVASGSLRESHEAMLDLPFMGPFMAYEVVTDLRHSPVLSGANDTMTWASAGPGAARGLDRVHGDRLGTRSHNSFASRSQMCREMKALLALANDTAAGHWPAEWPRWEMREVEHTLCEFDKHQRATLGEGRPKQRFTPDTRGEEQWRQ